MAEGYARARPKLHGTILAKAEFHAGELFARMGFIVTNLETDSRAVVRFYNKRGTAKQWIKEGRQRVKMTRLSRHRFRSNEARLWLSVIAYNEGNLWWGLALPLRVGHWPLTSLLRRVVKTGGRLSKHARHYRLLPGWGDLTRRLFGAVLRRIQALPAPAGRRRLGLEQTLVGDATEEGEVSEEPPTPSPVMGAEGTGRRRHGPTRAIPHPASAETRRRPCSGVDHGGAVYCFLVRESKMEIPAEVGRAGQVADNGRDDGSRADEEAAGSPTGAHA